MWCHDRYGDYECIYDGALMNTGFISTLQTIAPWIAFLFAITFHECAHALTAFWLGDATAKNQGRLSLNPIVHIDPIGLLCIFIFGIGWAKPVPMNQFNFRYPKFYAILCGLAGPLSNFILALIYLYAIKYIAAPLESITQTAAVILYILFKSGAQMNVLLGVFNMLPIPPLDGGHIINALIPDQWLPAYYRLTPFFIIFILIIVSFTPFSGFLMHAMKEVLVFLDKLVI